MSKKKIKNPYNIKNPCNMDPLGLRAVCLAGIACFTKQKGYRHVRYSGWDRKSRMIDVGYKLCLKRK